MLCDGEEEPYRVGVLTIELQKCPHHGYGARFYSSPTLNLQHQDTIHHAILAYICRACRGICVSEGAFVHHVILRHDGPTGFERDMNIRHGGDVTQRFHILIKSQLSFNSIVIYPNAFV